MELGDRQGKSSGITNKLLFYKSKRRIIKNDQNTEWLTKSSQTTCLDLFNKTQASWNPGCFKIHWKKDFKIANYIWAFSPIYSFFSPSESLCESESLKRLFRMCIWSAISDSLLLWKMSTYRACLVDSWYRWSTLTHSLAAVAPQPFDWHLVEDD